MDNKLPEYLFGLHSVALATLARDERVCLAAPIDEFAFSANEHVNEPWVAEKHTLLFVASPLVVRNLANIQESLQGLEGVRAVEMAMPDYLPVRYREGAVKKLKPVGRLAEGQELKLGNPLGEVFFRISKDAIEIVAKQELVLSVERKLYAETMLTVASRMDIDDLRAAVEAGMKLRYLAPEKPAKTVPPLGKRKKTIKPPVR